MGEPKVNFGDIANDIADAEDWLLRSNNCAGQLAEIHALRSIAASQMAIAKLLLRREVD